MSFDEQWPTWRTPSETPPRQQYTAVILADQNVDTGVKLPWSGRPLNINLSGEAAIIAFRGAASKTPTAAALPLERSMSCQDANGMRRLQEPGSDYDTNTCYLRVGTSKKKNVKQIEVLKRQNIKVCAGGQYIPRNATATSSAQKM